MQLLFTDKLVELLQNRRSLVPGHPFRMGGNVVALAGADGNKADRRHLDSLKKCCVVGLQFFKNIFAETRKIHFIDQHRHLLDAKHRNHLTMPL